MTIGTEYVTWAADDCHNPDVTLGLAELAAPQDGYQAARDFDEIDLWSQIDADGREAETLRQAGVEFDPNFCSVVIDAVNDRMAITSVTATVGTGEGAEDSAESQAATAALGDIWTGNQLGNYWPVWQRAALRDGDGYIVAWPSDFATLAGEESGAQEGDEMMEREDTEQVPTALNITYVDPRNGRMIYDDENPRIKRFFIQRWELPPENAGETKCHVRVNMAYPDRIEKYITKVAGKAAKASDFRQFIDEPMRVEYEAQLATYSESDVAEDSEPVYPWPMENPYGQIPAFHIRTDIQYGKPVHRNAWALQDAMSTLMRVLMVTVNFQGWPQWYALQEADNFKGQLINEDPLSDSPPSDWEGDYGAGGLDPNRIEDDTDDETGSRITLSPGALALLKGFKEIGQLEPANPETLLAPWREVAKAISSTTDTPLHKFQGMGNETPSGESLRMAERPLNGRVRKFHRLFGTTVAEFHEFSLMVLGYSDARVTVTWDPPETTDMLEVWDLIAKQVELGMPREIAFMRAGIPERDARAWVGESATVMDLERRVRLLNAVGDAIQKLGAGISLGVLDQSQATATITAILGDLAGQEGD